DTVTALVKETFIGKTIYLSDLLKFNTIKGTEKISICTINIDYPFEGLIHNITDDTLSTIRIYSNVLLNSFTFFNTANLLIRLVISHSYIYNLVTINTYYLFLKKCFIDTVSFLLRDTYKYSYRPQLFLHETHITQQCEKTVLNASNIESYKNVSPNLVSNVLIDSVPLVLHDKPRHPLPGYKKLADNRLAVLDILSSWVSGTSNKCRCTKARVLHILVLDPLSNKWINDFNIREGYSLHDPAFLYKEKEVVEINTTLNIWKECDEVIHFFLLKDWAINYA
ncbi:MAG: DUF5758 domain-containing protein, partial [Saprospiraceae bacterium]